MAKAKLDVTMRSTAGTGTFFRTRYNKKKAAAKGKKGKELQLTIRRYDRKTRKHEIFKESKK